jgi:hypothetical protein
MNLEKPASAVAETIQSSLSHQQNSQSSLVVQDSAGGKWKLQRVNKLSVYDACCTRTGGSLHDM